MKLWEVLRRLLPKFPDQELLEKVDKLLKETAQLVPVFRTIDGIIALYVQDRRLRP